MNISSVGQSTQWLSGNEQKHARQILRSAYLSTTALIAVISLSQPVFAADTIVSTPLSLPTNDTTLVTSGLDNITISNTGSVDYAGNGGASVMTAAGGTVSNSGSISVSGSDSLTINGALNTLTTGTVTVGGGDVAVTGDVTNESTSATALTIAAGMTLTTPNLNQNAGTATINGALSGNLVTGASGTTTVAATTGSISGNTRNFGTMSSAGTLTGSVTNEFGGALTISAGSTGAVVNYGTLTLSGGTVQTISDSLGSGTIHVTGNTVVSGLVKNTSVSATAVVIDATKSLTINGGVGTLTTWNGTVAINGTLAGNLAVKNGGNIATVGSAGTISGNTNNAGTLTNAGNLTGTVTNSGILTTTGTITGAVTNTGTLNASGTITGTLANNGAGTVTTTGNTTGITTLTQSSSGLITVAAGHTLSADTITVGAGSSGISIGAGSTLEGTGNTLNNSALIAVAAGGTITDVGAINNNASGTITFANGGTLAADIGSLGGLGINNAGILNVDSGTVFASTGTVSGTFTNTGQATITTGATLDVSGVSSGFTNTTGTLMNGGNLTGAVTNGAGGILSTTGAGSYTGSVASDGSLTMQNGAVGDTVAISGDFSGAGILAIDINTTLDTADTLTIGGNSSGTTLVSLNNLTPLVGTGNDITLITVTGTSAASDFTLASGTITAGAFNYGLSYLAGSFVLGESLNSTGVTYMGTPLVLGNFNHLQSMEQRIDGRAQRVGQAAWISMHGRNSKTVLTNNSLTNSNLWGVQVGTDLEFDPNETGRWVLGVSGQYGSLNSTVTDPLVGTGTIATTGYGVGLSATWYGNGGTYADAQGQINWLNSDLASSSAGSLVKGHTSTAQSLSVEVGHRFLLGANSAIVPQAQVSWGSIAGGRLVDTAGNSVNLGSNNSTIGRVGVAYEFARKGEAEKFYVIGNIVHDFSGSNLVTVAAVDMNAAVANPTSVQIGFGGTKMFGNMEIYGEAGVRTALGASSARNNTTIGGTFGFRMKF